MNRTKTVTSSAQRRERRSEKVINHHRKDAVRPIQEEPFEISANTLHMLDEAMQNLKAGQVSEPIILE